MAGFCLNFFILISTFAIFFFSILAVMVFLKSEALGIKEDNKIKNTIKIVIACGVKI